MNAQVQSQQPKVAMFKLQDGPAMTREQIIAYARMAELKASEIEKPQPVVLKDLAHERHVHRVDGRTVRILKMQDPKYGALTSSAHGETFVQLANLDSGVEIPIDEPVFILRGKDLCAPAAIDAYCRAVQDHATAVNQHTLDSAAAALERFFKFQAAYPGRCKLPT